MQINKITIVALALLAGASLSTAHADSAKDKKKAKTQQSVKPASTTDSLSYANGYIATQGLLPFIQQQYKVDTTYMADFVTGFNEAMAYGDTPQANARLAGMEIARMVKERIVPTIETEMKSSGNTLNKTYFNEGFVAAISNDSTVFNMAKANEYNTKALSAAGEKFLAENKTKPGVKTLADGLQYKVITVGTGEKPTKTDEVEVIYEGKLIDGTVFDATYNHPGNKKDNADLKPDKFNVGRLIKGWTEALTLMPVGSKWEIYIPQELAYGERPAGKIPPYSALIFTLELKSIVKAATPTTGTEKK